MQKVFSDLKKLLFKNYARVKTKPYNGLADEVINRANFKIVCFILMPSFFFKHEKALKIMVDDINLSQNYYAGWH